MPEGLSVYQLRAFFARNSSKPFSLPELKKKFGESVQTQLLLLSREGYLNMFSREGRVFYELGKR
jgi:hypothetical protein